MPMVASPVHYARSSAAHVLLRFVSVVQLEAAADIRHDTVDKHVHARHEQHKLKDWDSKYIIVRHPMDYLQLILQRRVTRGLTLLGQ